MYITTTWFLSSDGFKYPNIDQYETTSIEYAISIAEEWINSVITAGLIENDIEKKEPDLKIVEGLITAYDEKNTYQVKKARDIRQAIGRTTSFVLETDFNFIVGTFSTGIGDRNVNEVIDFESSKNSCEDYVKALLAKYYDVRIITQSAAVQFELPEYEGGLIYGDDRPITWATALKTFKQLFQDQIRTESPIKLKRLIPNDSNSPIVIYCDECSGSIKDLQEEFLKLWNNNLSDITIEGGSLIGKIKDDKLKKFIQDNIKASDDTIIITPTINGIELKVNSKGSDYMQTNLSNMDVTNGDTHLKFVGATLDDKGYGLVLIDQRKYLMSIKANGFEQTIQPYIENYGDRNSLPKKTIIDYFQQINDNSLTTTNKTIPSAINEINNELVKNLKDVVKVTRNDDDTKTTGIQLLGNGSNPAIQVSLSNGQITIFDAQNNVLFQTYPQNDNDFTFQGKTQPYMLYGNRETGKMYYGDMNVDSKELAVVGQLNMYVAKSDLKQYLSEMQSAQNTSITIDVVPLNSGNGTITAGFDKEKKEYYARIEKTNLQNIFIQSWNPAVHQDGGMKLTNKMDEGTYLVRYNFDEVNKTNSNDYIQYEFCYSGKGEKLLTSIVDFWPTQQNRMYNLNLLVNENGVEFKSPTGFVRGNVLAIYKRTW